MMRDEILVNFAIRTTQNEEPFITWGDQRSNMTQILTRKQVKPKLSEWTFLDVSTRNYTHAIHLYPARMHPEIAKKVIEKYAKNKSDIVFDPFMGSGGVLLESILHGNNAIGIDINPFAVLLSKVKTTPIRGNLSRKLNIILKGVKRDNLHKYDCYLPTDYDLDGWFKPDTLKRLASLKHNIYKIANPDIVDFFKICFSLTVRKSSYQRNSAWKIHRLPEEKRKEFKPKPIDIFTTISKSNIDRMEKLIEAKPSGIAYPILGDSRDISSEFTKVDNVLNDDKVDLMITSPPYGDHKTTVAYGQFSKHSGHWMDLPSEQVAQVDKVGLGGKTYNNMDDLDSATLNQTLDKIHKNDIKLIKGKIPYRAKDTYAFFLDLDSCLRQISQNIAPNGHACFVVANRTVRRVMVPTDIILTELGKKYGFSVKSTMQRDIPNKAMPSKNAPENITNETGNTMTRETIIIMRC